jgi:hypothetical protein
MNQAAPGPVEVAPTENLLYDLHRLAKNKQHTKPEALPLK